MEPLYKPFDFNGWEFQLLTLLLGNDERDPSIKCLLSTFSPPEPPDHTALSYYWGNPDDTKSIILND